jgi:hypothetical protein
MNCKNMNIRSFIPKSRRDDPLFTVGFSLRSEPREATGTRDEPTQRNGQGEALKSISVGQRPTERGVSIRQRPTERTTLSIPHPVRDDSSVEWIRAVAYRMPLGMRTYLTSVAYLRHADFFRLLPFSTELPSLTGCTPPLAHRALPCAIFIHRALPCANEYKAFSLKTTTLPITNLKP